MRRVPPSPLTRMERSARETGLARRGYEKERERIDAHGWHSHALPPAASVSQQWAIEPWFTSLADHEVTQHLLEREHRATLDYCIAVLSIGGYKYWSVVSDANRIPLVMSHTQSVCSL
eukprot:SM000370S13772  [mRNA]  locus=s370:17535:20490:+ [translate_table: standard]